MPTYVIYVIHTKIIKIDEMITVNSIMSEKRRRRLIGGYSDSPEAPLLKIHRTANGH